MMQSTISTFPPYLSLAIWLPILFGVLVLAVGRDKNAGMVRMLSLVGAIVSLLPTIPLITNFDNAAHGMQFFEEAAWIDRFNIFYRLGVDGLSLWFVPLTAFITIIVVLAAWEVIQERVAQYMGSFLILSGLMIGVFCALDGLLFYFFFEATLIPMFIIIGVWGGKDRVYASYKLFLYTLLGSVLMMLAVMAMYWQAGTTDMTELLKFGFPAGVQTWLWLACFAAFAVKMPMWPVHTWLPDAHVQAPTAGSVILAGVMLKLGGYGMIRILLQMFPLASEYFAPMVFALSVIAIIYTSLVAMMQDDIKKLIAYSSVAHMGYVTMGIFAANQQGVQGAIFQMLSHGIVSGALFLCVGVVYDRLHTREISAYGGLVNNMPKYAVAFMILTMANVGLPGTSGFVGEFLTIMGVFRVNTWVALFAATGVILSASYALWLYRRVIFGALEKEKLKALLDLSTREKFLLYPLVALTIFYGFYPMPVLNATAASVDLVVNNYSAALAAAKNLALNVH